MTTTNGAADDLKRRAERRLALLDNIAEAQEEIKLFKAEDKADGFSEKALGQVIRELRRGPDYQTDQLSLELEVHTYRAACELPVTLEEAQQAARASVETVPAAVARKGKRAAANDGAED